MTEVELNRASNMIDPQLHIWGWEIPLYLFLGGVTAGIMILTPLMMGRIGEDKRSFTTSLFPFIAPALLSLGMLALFLDLSYKLHVLRFYAAFRWTSPMSWGSWILVAIYPATLLLGLKGLSIEETRKLIRAVPLAQNLFGRAILWARDFALEHQTALGRVNVALGVGLGGYTGLLLGTLGARHVWGSAALGPLFLVSGVSTGAALMMMFPLSEREHSFLRRADLLAIGLELALLAAFLLGLSTGGAAGRSAASLFLGGEYTATFWSLVVFAGLLVPLALELFEGRRKLAPTMLAPLLVLVGGISLRWILVSAGQV